MRVGEYPIPLRWFTPVQEVPLCGHATLAAVAIMHQELGCVAVGAIVELTTASGPLFVSIRDKDYVLDVPARRIAPTSMPKTDIEAVLRTRVNEVYESADRYVCVLDDEEGVCAVAPNMTALSCLELPGLIVTAPGNDCDFVSRYFAPAKGVPEDPVTGTSHCTLAPFWSERLGKTVLRARQLSARGGQIDCAVNRDRVHLAGACRLYLRGTIVVPAPDAGNDARAPTELSAAAYAVSHKRT